MDLSLLARRNLSHYWRTNIAVVLGVAAAVAVLSGALLVGDSVRGSLRDLVAQRLGRTDYIVSTMLFFREALAKPVKGLRPPAILGRDASTKVGDAHFRPGFQFRENIRQPISFPTFHCGDKFARGGGMRGRLRDREHG